MGQYCDHLLSLSMNLLNLTSINRSELITASVVFVMVLSVVITSRLTRLTGNEAIEFSSNIQLTFIELSDLNDLE